MAEKEKDKDYGKTIIVGVDDLAEAPRYVYALIKSLQPRNYDKYNAILLQATEKNLPLADYIVGLLKDLWVYEENREKKKIKITKKDGTSYPLEVIEIVLKKHPKLRR